MRQFDDICQKFLNEHDEEYPPEILKMTLGELFSILKSEKEEDLRSQYLYEDLEDYIDKNLLK